MVEGMSVVVNVMLSLTSVMSPPLTCAHSGKVIYFGSFCFRGELGYLNCDECCCCCLPTAPCLFGGVLPYFKVTGHPVPVSALGFKCPGCFMWNGSYIVHLSKVIQGQLSKVLLPMIGVPDGGMGGRHS